MGKTDLSISLAKKADGAVISADSMQVYKGMDIGTAKITPDEMQGITHYLIDEFEPTHDFSVAEFKEYANKYMSLIYDAGKIPLIVGGTGFYIQSVIKDVDFTETAEDTEYRNKLYALAKEHGNDYLHDMLSGVDPESAKAIHANNVKRVIRALEFNHQTGEQISRHNEKESRKESPYNYAYFVLNDERNKLYERIDKRIDIMMEEGLVEEVEHLRDMGLDSSFVSMKGLGYKEILGYLNGEYALEEAVYILKRDTRHFAKRQLTWFRREKDVIWINKQDFDYDRNRILEFMMNILYDKKIVN